MGNITFKFLSSKLPRLTTLSSERGNNDREARKAGGGATARLIRNKEKVVLVKSQIKKVLYTNPERCVCVC